MKTSWLIISEDAERLRIMVKRARNPHVAAVLRMAANVLEQAAWELMNGRVSMSTIENLEVMEGLLKSKGLPTSPLRRARSIMARMVKSRIEEITGIAGEAFGLP